MSLLVNSAGATAADPVLNGLGLVMGVAASSMDVADLINTFVDQAAGFPGTNTVVSSVTPAESVVTAGAAGGYNDTTKQYSISDTTGLAAGDFIYLSHAAITDGVFEIATVVDATDFTLVSNPLDSSGDQTNISYQVAWAYPTTAGAAPMVSSAGGQINYFKADAAVSGGANTQIEDSVYVRNAPSGSAYIALDGNSYTGGTTSNSAMTLAILAGWANQGGIATVELANHSVQTANNFTWTSGGGTGEVALATAESGLTASVGDGAKYGRLLFRSSTGSATTVGVDISITVDTTGPVLTLFAAAA